MTYRRRAQATYQGTNRKEECRRRHRQPFSDQRERFVRKIFCMCTDGEGETSNDGHSDTIILLLRPPLPSRGWIRLETLKRRSAAIVGGGEPGPGSACFSGKSYFLGNGIEVRTEMGFCFSFLLLSFLSLSKSILSCAGSTRKVCRAKHLYYCRITLLFLCIYTPFFNYIAFLHTHLNLEE